MRIDWVIEDRAHIDSGDCWCEAVLYHTTTGVPVVWIHRAPDGQIPPLDGLIEAIAVATEDDDAREA
jgi:hypothetical protein